MVFLMSPTVLEQNKTPSRIINYFEEMISVNVNSEWCVVADATLQRGYAEFTEAVRSESSAKHPNIQKHLDLERIVAVQCLGDGSARRSRRLTPMTESAEVAAAPA